METARAVGDDAISGCVSRRFTSRPQGDEGHLTPVSVARPPTR